MLRILIITFFISNFASSAQQQDFTLLGKTSNIEDGNYLYLIDLVNGEKLDSAMVRNNRFELKTDLEESLTYSMLFTEDRKKFKELWLEGKSMTFDASNSEFKNAIITGSKSQELAKKIKSEVHANIVELPEDTIKKRETDFIKKYPNSLVSAYFLYGNRRMTQAETKELFSILSNDVRKSSLGKKIADNLKIDMPQIGEKFADFDIPNTENKNQSLSELLGNLTLIQFWSSSCEGSRDMNADLKKIFEQFHAQGFNIISISTDKSKQNWIEAIKKDNLTWPQLSNLNGWQGQSIKAYGISSTPSNILLNENGIIIGKNIIGNDIKNKILQNLK